MPPLPVVSGARCIAALGKFGYKQVRQKGSQVRLNCEGRSPVTVLVESKRSIFFSVGCDIRNFMVGYALAPEHPYATVVADDGTWALTDVPPGTWVFKAWHPKLGLKQATVTLGANGKASASFEFGK